MKVKILTFSMWFALAILPLPAVQAQTTKDAPKNQTPITEGSTAPNFTLENLSGKKISLSDFQDKSPVVVVFYRGYWCPFCGRQLAEMRELVKPGENVKILAISVDSPDVTKKFAEKIAADGKGAPAYEFLSDPDHKTIDTYGLHDPAYDGKRFDGIPHPAVYVVDKSGKIVWAKVSPDYRKRPSNDDIRAALATLKK